MQIDTYTKAVLTVIAIGVGLLVFDHKPVKDAHAAAAGKLRPIDDLHPIGEEVHVRVSAGGNNWFEFHYKPGLNLNYVRYCPRDVARSSGLHYCDRCKPYAGRGG